MSVDQQSRNHHKPIPWIVCILIIVAYLIPYGIVNRLPLHRYTIPFILGENYIPFLSWTFIIYLSAFVQAVIIIHHIPRKILGKLLIVISSVLIISLLFFIFVPIEYPRYLYLTSSPFVNSFRLTDGAGNCFPSLHVSMAVILAYCYSLLESSRIRRNLMWLWTVLIVISVLTTKQHYLIDIFGGVAIAFFANYIIKHYIIL